VPPPFRNRERDAQSVVALTDCLARVRVDAAADLFVKIQEFLEPRLKTKPKPVDAGLFARFRCPQKECQTNLLTILRTFPPPPTTLQSPTFINSRMGLKGR
jgi:hypothetical protein